VSKRDREWFAQLRLLLFAVISWFALSIAGELIGNQANETEAGQVIGRYVLLIAIVVVPVFAVGWTVLSLRARNRVSSLAADESPPPPKLFAPPVWRQPPELCNRRAEVDAAVELVCANGIVAIVGERDVGTSMVGQTVAQELIDHHRVDPRATTLFDVRGRATSGPDDAVVTAGQVVPAFGIAEPADGTDEALARVARELVAVFRASDGILVLDNVSTPEQVAWLVREWPPTGPRLVLIGENALGDLVGHSTVRVGEMSIEDMRALWRMVRRVPAVPWWRRRPFTHRLESDEELDELLRAAIGRPRAVVAFAHEVNWSGRTVADLVAELRRKGPATGTIQLVWQALLENIRAGLSADATRLLSALAVLPVTGLIEGAVKAMLGGGEPVALAELHSRNLVTEANGRYRLPQEYRRAIERTTTEEERRAVAARVMPALLRYYRESADLWAPRLETEPGESQRWFKDSERSFLPLYATTYFDDDLLRAILDDLCAIADGLTRWYVRERLPGALLAVHKGLYGLAERVGWLDVAALAAIRKATAHRMTLRFGEAAEELDIARTHIDKVQNSRTRAELDVRERAERALAAIDQGTGLPQAFESLSEPRATAPAVLINLGVLCLARGELDDASAHLLRAEELALDAGDRGAQAHSVELRGVVLAHRDLVGAVRLWKRARATFAGIGEREGEARCLQHLAAAAITDRRAAGQLLHGDPAPANPRAAALEAINLLRRAKTLRPRHPDTALADHYLSLAAAFLED
jgi:hypothetical protein